MCDHPKVQARADVPVDDRPDDGSATDPVRPCPARELTRPPSLSYIPHSKRERAIGGEGVGRLRHDRRRIRKGGGPGGRRSEWNFRSWVPWCWSMGPRAESWQYPTNDLHDLLAQKATRARGILLAPTLLTLASISVPGGKQ